MAFHGSGPIGNDQAIEEFGAILFLISDRVDESLDRLENSNTLEQVTMAGVTALRVLAQKYPQYSTIALVKSRLEEWRRRYFSWLDRVESRLPPRFREEIRSSAQKEFDLLLEHAAF